MEIIANAFVSCGKLHIRNKRKFDELIATWRDCPAIVTVERAHATRSKAQNDYYHSVVVPRVAAALRMDPKFAHEILKAQFLPHEAAQRGTNGRLMNGLVIGGSTTRLNKLEFIDYLEAIVMWSAETLKIYIPDPDREWRAHAEQEAADAAR